ncbi:PEP-CTERM sorting domain-containing protein [Phycisphaera mikurensis]|nr:PEP-CTERM sorting domain-containing protein [Phycisphaera mikurensis]MBB6441993.1 hypothetical protein [Phycisphaera mikurensis]
MTPRPVALIAAAALAAPAASAAPVVLNEYNAVSGSKQLDDGAGADAFFGTIDGNGGNWFELLVIEDTDLRGWQLAWTEAEETFTGSGINTAGTLTLTGDALWSDVKAGSLITFIETADGGGSLLDTSTDTSYDPVAGDWTINVATREEAGKAAGLVTTTTNDGSPGDFSVGNEDWTLTILDAGGVVRAAATGEGAPGYAGDKVNSREGFALEGPGAGATLADFQAIGADSSLYDDTSGTTYGSLNADLQPDGSFVIEQDVSALRNQIPEPGTAALAAAGLGLLASRRRRG